VTRAEPARLSALADRAFRPAATALEAGAIPGAALGLVTADGARAVRVAGLAQRTPASRPATRETWWDIASLTKVLATLPAVLALVEEGLADLDDPLSRHLPELAQYRDDGGVRALTLRQCLAHATWLPAVRPLYAWGLAPAALQAAVLQHDWSAEGRQDPPVYSDINFILLGLLVARLRGAPFATAALPASAADDGAGLGFGPPEGLTAATELCPWRGRLLVGEVHDENAAALGGAAGHAGLFATVDGVLEAARRLLAGEAMSAAAFAEATAEQGTGRGLGWERRRPGWTGGSLASPNAVGHTGFTGVALWLDPPRGIAWTLLTNRVHPSRHRETGIMDLRRAVSNIVCAGAG
jgi:CubicO group peptidase (beta-lactamase class C family)